MWNKSYQYHNVEVSSHYLVSVRSLEVILIDGGVDVTLAGEEVKGVVHFAPGHVLLHTGEDGIPVYARLIRALLDQPVHQVVVLVAKALVGRGRHVARGSAALDSQPSPHHGLGQTAITSHNLSIDLLLELSELEVAVDNLQEVGVILGLASHLADLESHDVLLILMRSDGAHHLDGMTLSVLRLVGSLLEPLGHLNLSAVILNLKIAR